MPDSSVSVKLNLEGRDYSSGDTISISHSQTVPVIVHELGHQLESRNSEVLKASVEFLKRRTEGEGLQKLFELTGKPYMGTEETRPDRFSNPYIGKMYGRTGSYDDAWATEVISMGLQYLYEDPAAFALADPDYFDFLWILLRSKGTSDQQ